MLFIEAYGLQYTINSNFHYYIFTIIPKINTSIGLNKAYRRSKIFPRKQKLMVYYSKNQSMYVNNRYGGSLIPLNFAELKGEFQILTIFKNLFFNALPDKYYVIIFWLDTSSFYNFVSGFRNVPKILIKMMQIITSQS